MLFVSKKMYLKMMLDEKAENDKDGEFICVLRMNFI